jgi:hypothetical protein
MIGLMMVLLAAAARRQAQANDDAGPPLPAFRIADVDDRGLGVWEGSRPVLVYNHGVRLVPGVPADRARSSYIHPLYGLDGVAITDDFPKDHYHHRGLFWAWPHVTVDGRETDLWALKGIETRFVRWVRKDIEPDRAILEIENGWFTPERKAVREEVRITVHHAQAEGRAIDLDLTITPLEKPITIEGAEGKSYGGPTLRFAPAEEDSTRIIVPSDLTKEDLYMTPLPWADLTRRWVGSDRTGGATVLIAPDHPDYPPTWLTRHYGVLCVGWPGVKARTLEANKPVRLRYRVWIHDGTPDASELAKVYARYLDDLKKEDASR